MISAHPASAEDTRGNPYVVPACGSGVTYIAGNYSPLTIDVNGELCLNVNSGAFVSSFNGRTGSVQPLYGDYFCAQIINCAPIFSPQFQGFPSAPTQAAADLFNDDGLLATDGFVYNALTGATTFAVPATTTTTTYGYQFLESTTSGSATTSAAPKGFYNSFTLSGTLSNWTTPNIDSLLNYVDINGSATTLPAAIRGIRNEVYIDGSNAQTITSVAGFYSDLNAADASATVTTWSAYSLGIDAQAGSLTNLNGYSCANLSGSYTIGTYNCINNADATAVIQTSGPIKSSNYIDTNGTTQRNVSAGHLALNGVATAGSITTDGGQIYISAAHGINIAGLGSTDDLEIENGAGTEVINIPTGTTNVRVAGTLTVAGTGTSGVSTAACFSASFLLVSDSANCITSKRSLKHDIAAYDGLQAVEDLKALKPATFMWNADAKPDGDVNYRHQQIGFIADDVLASEPRCASTEQDGSPQGYEMSCLIAVSVAAQRQMQHELQTDRRDIHWLMGGVAVLALWCGGLTLALVRRK